MAMRSNNDGIWEETVTPVLSDTVSYSPPVRGAYVMASGTLSILTHDNITETWVLASVPFYVPRYIKRFNITGTVTITAADIRTGR